MYHYDVDDPEEYGSDNNRLMKSKVLEPIGGDVQSKTYYYYGESGVYSDCGNRW